MNERRFQFRVGIAVLLVTIVIAGVLIFLVGDRSIWPFADRYQIKIRFPEASGVQPGTPVRKFGKLIGRVDSVEIVQDGVLVTVSIDKDQKLPASDVPEVSTSLIGGDAVIEFVSRRRRDTGGVTGSNPYSFLFGPFVALVVVGVLALLLRWAFSRGGSLVERTPRAGTSDEYGLLVPVAAPEDYASGELLRRRLEDHGVRAMLTTTSEGPRVMVFPDDADRARLIVRP